MFESNGALRSFRHRNFRILFPANFLSNIGTWSQRVAQDWLVLELTHSAKELGIVTGLQFLPSLLFSLHAGSLADRFNKKKLLMFTNLGGALTAIILGILVITKHAVIYDVYFLAFALGAFSALDAPVRQTFTSEIVGKSDLANAVSLNSANFNAGRLFGPGITGIIIAAFGTGPAFLLNGATYLIVFGSLFLLRESDLHITEEQKSDAKIREGFAYVRARKDILAVMWTVLFAATFGLNFQIFTAIMATQVFEKGPRSYGLLGSIVAIGSLSGALMSAKLDRRRSPKFIMGFATAFGLSVMLSSVTPSYFTYALSLPLCGSLALTTMIAANSYVQTNSHGAIRGRVLGIYLLIFMGGSPFGAPLIGWMCTQIGVRQTIAGCGAITSLAAVVIYFLFAGRMDRPASIAVEDVLALKKNQSGNTDKNGERH